MKAGGPLPTAVTVTVTASPAVRSPLAGLIVSPVGPVIANDTGPPLAVSANVALSPSSGMRIVAGDSESVPGGGVGDGVGDLVGDLVGVGLLGLVVGFGATVGLAELGAADGDAEAAAFLCFTSGDFPGPVGDDDPDALGDAPSLAAPCAAALAVPPPWRSMAAAATPPTRTSSRAATVANAIVRPRGRNRASGATETGNPERPKGSAWCATCSR